MTFFEVATWGGYVVRSSERSERGGPSAERPSSERSDANKKGWNDVKNLAQKSTEQLAKRILKLKDEAGELYSRIDILSAEVLRRNTARIGVVLDLEVKHGGELYRLTDTFEAKNVAWRPARVARFELVRVPKPKKVARGVKS